MSGNDDLKTLLEKTMAVFGAVDKHVMRSHFVRKQVLQFDDDRVSVGFDRNDPEAYLEDDDSLEFWDQDFEHILQEWDQDVDGDQISKARYDSIVERLSLQAAALDQYPPRLLKK
jgi:hypothetical protein